MRIDELSGGVEEDGLFRSQDRCRWKEMGVSFLLGNDATANEDELVKKSR